MIPNCKRTVGFLGKVQSIVLPYLKHLTKLPTFNLNELKESVRPLLRIDVRWQRRATRKSSSSLLPPQHRQLDLAVVNNNQKQQKQQEHKNRGMNLQVSRTDLQGRM
ncbi:unnamed protein product [Linum tenue]|uniref:Uncharacterized protein n=1 Tax=Linum tenue TaxID=586396 RepID=A0AAV0ILS4_9ROSI|nr:unnamed protein product [Linum tenue]